MMRTKIPLKMRITMFLLLVLFVSVVPSQGLAEKYYVDYVGGNDSNNGTSKATPWKHSPGDAAATSNANKILSAGDTVIFKGGVTYTGTGTGTLITINASGNSGNYITYRGNTVAGDWGSGEAIIDGNSDYYHLIHGEDKDYIKVINIDFTGGKTASGQEYEGMLDNRSGEYWLIQDCVFHEPEDWDVMCALGSDGTPATQRGIMMYGNGTDHIEIDSCEFYAMPYPIRLYSAEHVDIHDCDISGATSRGGTGGGYMSLAILITRDCYDINIYDNLIHDGWRYEGDEAQKRCHSGDWIHIYGSYPDYRASYITIERNFMYNDRDFQYTHGTADWMYISDGTHHVWFRNNVCINNHAGRALYMKDNTAAEGPDYVYVHNNTFVEYGSNDAGHRLLDVGPNCKENIEIKNNIIYMVQSTTKNYKSSIASDSMDIDYNVYYKGNGTTIWDDDGHGGNQTWSQWQSLGWDSNGYYGNPLFVHLPATGATSSSGDYQLTSSSTYCINKGYDLSSLFTDDKNGVTRPSGSAWDIGAYEFTGAYKSTGVDVTDFNATEGNTQITLTWTNPSDSDFVGTMIRFRTDGTYPLDHNDGTLVCNKTAAPGSSDGFVHTGLQNGTTYYYSAFTYDEVPNYSDGVYVNATPTAGGPPPDDDPPADVTYCTGTEGNTQITLTWTNPSDSDFVGTMIRFRTDGTYPLDHNDGTLVCDKKAAPGSSDGFVHHGLQNDTTYYYSAFTYDEVPNYSDGVYVSATPTAESPPPDEEDPTYDPPSEPTGLTVIDSSP
jgi:hypothetical protein